MAARTGLWKALGPGVLFTGAAVGVSHLVQSTRAGAGWGLALVPIVLLANLVKYPAFRFGPHYAAATGTSLLEGYRRQGRWALSLYGLLTLGTMFTVQAAVTLVTAALLGYLTGVAAPTMLSAGLIATCAALLAVGQYRWLDRISKVVVSLLAVATLLATVLALPELGAASLRLWPTMDELAGGGLFLAGLIGWMPSAIDVAAWQSLWTLARARTSGHRPTVRESATDFHIGYWGTALLALCFVVLGAAVMHARGEAIEASPVKFGAQLVELYARTLGAWSRPLIATAATLVMFSTTLTVVDGFPRALTVLVARFRRPEIPEHAEDEERGGRPAYWGSMVLLGVVSLTIIGVFAHQLTVLVDLATTLSFLTAPALAWLNHRAVFGAAVPEALRPARWLWWASWGGILAQGAFAVYYLGLRFFA